MKRGGVIYPFEMHLPGYNFAGPFTQLEKRLDENDNPLPNSIPINKIDKISLLHDFMYRDYPSAKGRQVADQIMLNDLDALDDNDLTTREKIDRRVVRPLIAARKFVGFGLRPQAPASESEAKEMHHRIIRKFPRRSVIVHNIDDIWSADLVEMPPDKQSTRDGAPYKYILTVIDLFSKYAWAIPLKNKQSSTVIDAFDNIIKLSKCSPNKLWTDAGSEFINKQFKKFLTEHNSAERPTGIELHHTYNEGKACVIERFNRTLKEKMWFNFTVNGNKHWIDLLDKLVNEYNNSFHRTVRMTPTFASMKENDQKVKENLLRAIQSKNARILQPHPPRFHVGDLVRIYKWKK